MDLSLVTSAVTGRMFASFDRSRLQRLKSAAADRDRRARLRQRRRDGRADAGSAAGDQRMPAGKRAHARTADVVAASAVSARRWS